MAKVLIKRCLQMTKRLYHEDPYAREFTAKVVEVKPEGVVLDQTCFYAESGGQLGDTGKLNGAQVTDTKFIGEEKDSNILHYCDPSSFSVGQEVKGEIDWDRRYSMMRIHSALHLLYYITKEIIGPETESVSSGVAPGKGRMDFSCDGKLDAEMKDKVHARFKEIVSEGRDVKSWDDGEKDGYRFCEISGYEKMPCGGTHVKNLSEIGETTMKRESKGRGIVRLTVKLA